MMKILASIRKRLKISFDKLTNEKFKLNLLQAIPFWIASLLTGLVAVLYTKLFAAAEKVTHYIFQNHGALLFIISPVCFVVSWWMVQKFSPYSRGSGIPQVMAAIELATPKHNDKVGKLLSLRIIFVKIISSLTMALGGGIIGREGPTIQIAGSIFRKINSILPEWWPKISKRNMIMTGAAAGLAAAFNTPLGGIVFAVEELTKTHISYFKTALFTAVIISGLTAQGLLGPYLYIGYPNVNNLSSWIFGWVVIVAIAAGLSGSLMGKGMLYIMRWKSKFKFTYQQILYLIGSSLIIVALAYFINDSILGSGKDLMQRTLFSADKHIEWYQPLFRIWGSLLSFTTGTAGGVFAPALSAGASIGALLAECFNVTTTNANLLILCGMVGFLTGVTRSPFTSAILVLEMTDRHSVIFQLMLAGMIASIVSIPVDRHSLYDHLKFQYMKEVLDEEHEDKEEIKAARPS